MLGGNKKVSARNTPSLRAKIFTLCFILLVGAFTPILIPSVALAAPVDPTEAACKAVGGEWKNLAPTGGVPKMGCAGVSIADQQTLDWQVKSLLYYRAMGKCLNEQTHTSRTFKKVKEGDIFGGGMVAIGPYVKKDLPTVEDDSIAACDSTLVKKATDHWGISVVDLMCEAGFTWLEYRGDHGRCKTAQLEESDQLVWGDRGSNGFNNGTSGMLSYLKNTFYNGKTPELSTAGWYQFYRNVFFLQCSTSQSPGSGDTRKPSTPNSRDVSFFDVNSNGTISERWYRLDKNMVNKSFTTRIGGAMEFSDVNRTCEEIAATHLNESNAQAFAKLLKSNPDQATPPPVNDPAGDGDSEANPTSCTIDGVGWIVCGITQFLAKITDALYGWIVNFLVVQPLNVNTGASDNTTYIAWTGMRNIANIAFAIAFLIIIFSQLTGTGITNYGVKKMLPRLIVAAILVNISYWVAAIAVDVFNIIGNNIYNYLRGLADTLGDVSVSTNGWEVLATFLLSGGAIAGTTYAVSALVSAGTMATLGPVALYAFIVFILGIVLALIVAFVILALRQAIIIILIVISPLAFVAMLLPNTEKYFGMWRKTLTTMLIFYPLFSILFGGSALAGMVIIGSAGQASESPAVGMMVLMGMVITVLPLWLTPLIIRFSTGVMGQVAGIVNNRSKGLIDRARNVRNRKANLAMHETLGNPKNSRNPFGRVYRRVQNGAQRDADRKKVIESNNKASYLTSEAGSDMAYRTSLGDSQVEAANSYNNARFQETLSSSQTISADHPLRAEVEAARQAHEEINIAKNRVQSAQGILQQEYAQELASRPSLAQRAGGIDPRGQSRVVASAQAALDRANDEAMKAAALPLKQEVARLKATGGDSDGYLRQQFLTATDEDTQDAALDMLASLGRDGVIRGLQNTPGISADDRARIQRAIDSNAGALVGKAPDLVKGAAPAFDNVKGSDMVGFSSGTARAHAERLRDLFTRANATAATQADRDAFDSAITSFSSAIEDIRRNPTLQGQFGGDVGRAIKEVFSDPSTPAGFRVHDPSSIDGTTGKIR